MSEGENQQQEDELWVEVPEPEEITEQKANELPIDVFAEEEASLMSSLQGLRHSAASRNEGRTGTSISVGDRSEIDSTATTTFECPCFSSRTIFVPSATLNAFLRRVVFVAS